MSLKHVRSLESPANGLDSIKSQGLSSVSFTSKLRHRKGSLYGAVGDRISRLRKSGGGIENVRLRPILGFTPESHLTSSCFDGFSWFFRLISSSTSLKSRSFCGHRHALACFEASEETPASATGKAPRALGRIDNHQRHHIGP